MSGRMRPWHKRARELEPTEFHYCDWAAFKEWLSNWECKLGSNIMDSLEPSDDVNLYVILCDTFDAMEPETRDEQEQACMESMRARQ